jgi:hypothetical protein
MIVCYIMMLCVVSDTMLQQFDIMINSRTTFSNGSAFQLTVKEMVAIILWLFVCYVCCYDDEE